MEGLVRDVILRDGSTLRLRSPSPDDTQQIKAFFDQLEPRSLYMRFRGIRDTSAVARAYAEANGDTRMALIARQSDRIVALASYDRLREPGAAEVAFAVSEDYQGRGIATRMLEQLAGHASKRGINRFDAEVLAYNSPMLRVFQNAGFDIRREGSGGELHLDFDIRPSRRLSERIAERDHQATVASLKPLLSPRSVAVIGVSDRPDSVGQTIFKNLIEAGFGGQVTPVNRSARMVCSHASVVSVTELDTPPDLCVIAVPASEVVEAASDAASAGARALIVVSSGFSESQQGRAREAELMEVVRSRGLRLLGPNSLGALNTAGDVCLNATLAQVGMRGGHIAISSQSGALGMALLGHAAARGLGISSFVSLGNRPDISTNDLLEFWEEDTSTSVVLLYVESFGNPRRFSSLSRRVSRRKPILAVKGNRRGGTSQTGSHTAAALHSEAASDALLRQAGVLRVETTAELFDAARFFECQPLPRGRRVGVVTNSGGLGTIATDACATRGLTLPTPNEDTLNRLNEALPQADHVTNPIDMSISAGPSQYANAVEAMLSDDRIDSIVACYVDLSFGDPSGVLEAIEKCWQGHDKPVAVSVICSDGSLPRRSEGAGVSNFRFVETCAGVLSLAADRREWLSRPIGQSPQLSGIDVEAARARISRLASSGQYGWLSPVECEGLLSAFGIPHVASTACLGVEDAVQAARRIGGPIVLKAIFSPPAHAGDVDAVLLGLEGEAAIRSGFAELKRRVNSTQGQWMGCVVQPLLEVGADVLAGAVTDTDLGPVVSVGPGGRQAGLSSNTAFGLTPLTDTDVDLLLDSSWAVAAWLGGFRGSVELDRTALRELVLRLARLVDELPEVAEVDLNPVRVLRIGCSVLDARIRIQPRVESQRVKTW
jgi:acetate---CoA ligase (ADP-forming)